MPKKRSKAENRTENARRHAARARRRAWWASLTETQQAEYLTRAVAARTEAALDAEFRSIVT